MGGLAFRSSLATPRMPKPVYESVKARCHSLLLEHYFCVASPIEGPGKEDFGDVDVLVAWPRESEAPKSKQETLSDISSILGAVEVIVNKGKDVSANFALPWPLEPSVADQEDMGEVEILTRDLQHSELSHNTRRHSSKEREEMISLDAEIHSEALLPATTIQSNQKGTVGLESLRRRLPDATDTSKYQQPEPSLEPSNTDLKPAERENAHRAQQDAGSISELGQEKYIQVDVRVCESLEHLQWMLFKHAHGDIWNLLGTVIRPYGLTVDEDALWLRVPEIESYHRNRSKVFLSADPVEILRFLGLPISNYWGEPFEDLDSMYEYVACCRMFWVWPVDSEWDGSLGQSESAQDRAKLKANDRRRMNMRPAFRRWVEEFYPKCRQQGRFLKRPTTRQEITEEAFAVFGVEREFEDRRLDFLRQRQRDMVWNRIIKGSIPEVASADLREIQYRSCLVKALKRIILEGDDRYGVMPDEALVDEQGFYVVDSVVDFIVRHQEQVGKAAMEQNTSAYIEYRKKRAVESPGK